MSYFMPFANIWRGYAPFYPLLLFIFVVAAGLLLDFVHKHFFSMNVKIVFLLTIYGFQCKCISLLNVGITSILCDVLLVCRKLCNYMEQIG